MYASQNDNLLPPRSGIRRLIAPWEYRRLRFWAAVRFAVSILALGFGTLALSYGSSAVLGAPGYGWAVPLLVAAAGNFLFGYWEMTIVRSTSPRA